MDKKNKLFLCGITCGPEIEKIKKLIESTKEYVDGFCWAVDDRNGEEIFQYLNSNKKDGKIVMHPFMCAHDWQANQWLYCGALQNGDWVWLFDSSEEPTEKWENEIHQMINEFEEKGIGSLYCSGRPYLFKFYDHQYFHGTPHWGLIGTVGEIKVLPESEKGQWIINKRDDNPAKHYQEHDTKYYLYGRSNQIQAFYAQYSQIHPGIIQYHENVRLQFREYLRQKTGMSPGLAALDKLFSGPLEEFAIGVIDLEFCLSEYYQRTVVGMDFMKDIVPNRYKWSIRQHLKNGDGFSDPSYISTKMKYENLMRIKLGHDKQQ